MGFDIDEFFDKINNRIKDEDERKINEIISTNTKTIIDGIMACKSPIVLFPFVMMYVHLRVMVDNNFPLDEMMPQIESTLEMCDKVVDKMEGHE